MEGGQSMTKEQAIEIIEKMIKSYIEADACGLSNNDFKYEIRAMQTVLSMLKEKDKEIEELQQELAKNIARNFTSSMKETSKAKEDLEMLNKGWQIELEEKDKIIDLIIKVVYKRFKAELLLEYGFENEEQFKQYFERKSKE